MQNIQSRCMLINHLLSTLNFSKCSCQESSHSLPSSAPWPHSPSPEADSPPRYVATLAIHCNQSSASAYVCNFHLPIVATNSIEHHSPVSRWPTSLRPPSVPEHSRPLLVSIAVQLMIVVATFTLHAKFNLPLHLQLAPLHQPLHILTSPPSLNYFSRRHCLWPCRHPLWQGPIDRLRPHRCRLRQAPRRHR